MRAKSEGRKLSIKLAHGAAVGIVAALFALLLHVTGALVRFELKTWDWRVNLIAKPSPATDQIRLIFLDQDSLDWGQKQNHLAWPWPRETYALIAEYCRRCGAKAIGMDVLFTEPSFYQVDDDVAFGIAIAAFTGFPATVFLGREQGSTKQWPADIPAPSNITIAAKAAELRTILTEPLATFPIPEVATNADLMVNVAANPDRDSIYRRIHPVRIFDGRPIPALGLGLYLTGHPGVAATITPNAPRSPYALRLGTSSIPLDAEGRAILNFRGPSQTHKTINAKAVIQSELAAREGAPISVDPSVLKDKYVLFGFTAPGLYDLRAAPLAGVYPGVEIHATLLDNLLAGDAMRDSPRGLTILALFVLSILAATAVRLSRTTQETIVAWLIMLPIPFILGLLAYQGGVWLPVMPLWAGTLPAMVAALVLNYATEGRQKRFIKGAFKQYLSPAFVEQLMHDPNRLKLGGETRELTIYFSDIKGFTGISEKLGAEKLTALLNRYLTVMSDIIQESGGTVDKYIGDAVVAFWNAPLDQADHAALGVKAALECQRILEQIRPALETEFGAKIYARIGLNTGPVVIGNMGSNQRFNYTFLGDAGNLASRLEGINKKFATYIAMSQFTRDRLGDLFRGRELSRITVVGRQEPVRIYEPVTEADYAERRPLFAAFEAALALYYAGRFAEAAAAFEALAGEDPTSAIYARRCGELAADPPATWDGVWAITEK